MAVDAIIWIGNEADKLYHSEGAFTGTLSDSLWVGTGAPIGIDAPTPRSVAAMATDTIFTDATNNKFYRVAGGPSSNFQATLVDSVTETVGGAFHGIDFDGTNTLNSHWNKFWLLSGAFTSTILNSRSTEGVTGGHSKTAWDGSNVLLLAANVKFYRMSGFTQTISASTINNGTAGSAGLAWDTVGAKLYSLNRGVADELLRYTGFTSTIDDSRDVSSIDTSPAGITVAPRLGSSQTIVAVGLASETDTAFAVTLQRTYAIGLATETDTAFSVTVSQTVVSALVRGLLACELAGLDVVNSALVKLGAARITSLVQDHPNALVAHDIYLDTLDEELRAHVWNFAKAKRRLAQSGTAPVSGFDFAYPLPVDCLRVINVHGDDNESFTPPYEIVGRTIETDWLECWLTYIRRECDFSKADASFFEVMAYRLAIEMAASVTGLVSERDTFLTGYRRAMLRARSTDAIEDYPEQMPESPLITVRH